MKDCSILLPVVTWDMVMNSLHYSNFLFEDDSDCGSQTFWYDCATPRHRIKTILVIARTTILLLRQTDHPSWFSSR